MEGNNAFHDGFFFRLNPLPHSHMRRMGQALIYGVIALSVALKVSNLMATLVVVSSVEDQLLRLHNLFFA